MLGVRLLTSDFCHLLLLTEYPTGTNTDCVLVDISKFSDKLTRGVAASYKHITTSDVTTGIELAVQKVLEKAGLTERTEEILSLTIGTTVCHS